MNARRGIALKVASVLLFTVMATCVKAASEEVPPGESVFFRSLFAMVPVVGYLAYLGEFPAALRTSNPLGHAWRGLLGVVSMGLNFTALGLLPLSDAIAIGYTMPLLATLFAAIFLGETVRFFRWSAIVIGFVGVLVMLWPRLTFLKGPAAFSTDTIGALCALAGAAIVALATVVVRKLVVAERTSAIVFYFSLTCTAASLLTIPFGWSVPTAGTAAVLVLSGLSGGLAQVLLTETYRHTDTSTIAPFEYTSMLFAIVIGYLLFGEAPTLAVLAGALIVIAAGLIIIYREHRLGLERHATRKTSTQQG